MRALIVSHFYSNPEHRGKLRALAGQSVDVMAALPGGSAALDNGVRLAPVPVSGDPEVPGMLKWNRAALRRVISDFHPDLIQVEEGPGAPVAGVVAATARRMRIPYVIFSWESLARRRGFLEQRRARSVVRHAAGIIGGNRLALALLRDHAPDAVTAVLPQTGMSPSAPIPRNPEHRGLAVGLVGRLVPERGAETLLRACGLLLGPWTLTVVGTGPEQETLEALAQKLGLASRIRWLGGIPKHELETVWNDLDCLVVPSRDTSSWVERSSPLLLEAMVRGVVPVVTRAGALPEIVGDAGIVVDDVESLALALQHLMAEPERLRVLGQLSRQRVLEEYVDSAVAQRTLAFWEQVLARYTRHDTHLTATR
ncbi:MAG TPA: glycosyltransferase [Gemmatimonadales bacterium]|nr:glycosyltransferase [Gemmatimonadales bacterium]